MTCILNLGIMWPRVVQRWLRSMPSAWHTTGLCNNTHTTLQPASPIQMISTLVACTQSAGLQTAHIVLPLPPLLPLPPPLPRLDGLTGPVEGGCQAAGQQVDSPQPGTCVPADAGQAGSQPVGLQAAASTALKQPPAGMLAASTALQQSPACVLAASGTRLRVAVALSGGVDSAVAALLLRQQGHDVFGVFMRNWDAQEEGGTTHPQEGGVEGERGRGGRGGGGGGCHERDLRDARAVAARLGITLHEVDFVRQYWDKVFSQFLEQYARGATPNPDLACNRHIKFGCLLQAARDMGAEAVATGHYARLEPHGDSVQMLRSAGPLDQSYFLAALDHSVLRHYLFPVGGMIKAEVREVARHHGLEPANKRSSRGICFIGPRSFDRFMAEYIHPVPGSYVFIESDGSPRPLGPCPDLLPLTVGQRVHVAGRRDSARLYVVGKDMTRGVAYVVAGQDHPALAVRQVLLGPITWVAGANPGSFHEGASGGKTATAAATAAGWQVPCDFKASYRQPHMGHCIIMAPPAHFHASRFHHQSNGTAANAHSDGMQGTDRSERDACQVREQTAGCVGSVAGGDQGGGMRVSCSDGDHEGWEVHAGGVAVFSEPLRDVAPQQVLVLYDGAVVLGSAVMMVPGRTLFEQGDLAGDQDP